MITSLKKCGKKKHPFSPDRLTFVGQCDRLIIVQSMGAVCAHFSFKKREVSIINKRVIPNNVNDDLVNEKIRFREVLVIGPTGQQLGIKSRQEALEIAYSQDLDLLCVSPNSNPPVCKILNYGRYHFEQQKKSKEAKKKQHVTEVKPLRLSPVIDTHDFETKLRQARKWAQDGMKVKIDMRFRGRLITRIEVGRKIMNEFVEAMSDVANVEKKPSLEGNTMSCVLAPKKVSK